jgi:hypothetical protein
MKRPIKLGRGNELGHASFALAQAGEEAVSRLALEFARAKGSNGPLGRRRRFPPPRFNTPLAQQTFKHFLFLHRQRFGFGQHAI